MPNDRRVEIAKRYFRAMCAGNYATFDSLMAPDVCFIDSAGETIEGFAACQAAARVFHRIESNCRFEIGTALARGETILLRARVTADNPRIRGDYLLRVRIPRDRISEWQTFRPTPLACARLLTAAA